MGGNFCQILQLGGITIKGRRVGFYLLWTESKYYMIPEVKMSATTNDQRTSMLYLQVKATVNQM